MNKFGGVVLDWFDDEGATLKTRFPSVEDLPDQIKTASIPTREEIPDEDFALIALNGGDVLKKFACGDPGTTAMSVIYFMEHGHKLPDDAVKTAASNLVEACMRHDIMPPAALVKAAKWLGWKKELTTFPTFKKVLKRGGKATEEGAKATEKGEAAAKDSFVKRKGKEFGEGAGEGAIEGAKKKVKSDLGSAAKAVGKYVGIPAAVATGTTLAVNKMTKGKDKDEEEPKSEPKSKSPSKPRPRRKKVVRTTREVYYPGTKEAAANVVDITGKSPMTRVKTASQNPDDFMYEDPRFGIRMFPIDTWDRIKTAESYLLDNWPRMDKGFRRQCCVKLATRAKLIGHVIDDRIKTAGATTMAGDDHIAEALEMRKVAGADPNILDDLMEKRAALGPDTFAETLRVMDIDQGLDDLWDDRIPDPWASTFMVKQADVVWSDATDCVTDTALQNLAINRLELVTAKFTDDFANEFRKDPIAMFKSMPAPQKKVLARMAEDSRSDGSSDATSLF